MSTHANTAKLVRDSYVAVMVDAFLTPGDRASDVEPGDLLAILAPVYGITVDAALERLVATAAERCELADAGESMGDFESVHRQEGNRIMDALNTAEERRIREAREAEEARLERLAAVVAARKAAREVAR